MTLFVMVYRNKPEYKGTDMYLGPEDRLVHSLDAARVFSGAPTEGALLVHAKDLNDDAHLPGVLARVKVTMKLEIGE